MCGSWAPLAAGFGSQVPCYLGAERGLGAGYRGTVGRVRERGISGSLCCFYALNSGKVAWEPLAGFLGNEAARRGAPPAALSGGKANITSLVSWDLQVPPGWDDPSSPAPCHLQVVGPGSPQQYPCPPRHSLARRALTVKEGAPKNPSAMDRAPGLGHYSPGGPPAGSAALQVAGFSQRTSPR